MNQRPVDGKEKILDRYPVIIPNLNRRFSGITSTILEVVPEQQKTLEFASVGYRLSDGIPHLSWLGLLRLTARPLSNGALRVFHCRRNIEMCYGLILKHLLRRKLQLIFTSTAQRHHTRFTRFLYHRMDHVITTSPRAGSYLDLEPEAVIPHGIDIVRFQPTSDPAADRAALGLENRFSIGIFGRVREQKGIREFIKALCMVLPRHPDFNAVIVGETTPKFVPFEREMRRMLAECGLAGQVQWLGKVDFELLPRLFRAMSLVCAVSRNEGFGLTCLEAMASGVPVIATRTGGFDMAIRPGIDGAIVPCGDAEALAAELEKMLSLPQEQLVRMGRSARARILAEFTVAKEAAALNGFYRKILNFK